MRDPRQKSSPLIIFALILSWILILVGGWRAFFRDSSSDIWGSNNTTTNTEDAVQYYIDEDVLLEWTLTVSDDISQYAQILTDERGQEFGLKSSEIVLNGFSGKVQVRGTVVWFKKERVIVDVSAILGDSEEDTVASSGTEQNTTSYSYFEQQWLAMNIANFPWYTIKQLWNDIQLLNTLDQTVLTITPFQCIKNDPLKDCDVLKKTSSAADRFTTAAGVSYYSIPETNRWIIINKQGTRWFDITAPTEQSLQTHASVIQFVEAEDFAIHMEEARLLCKDLNSSMASVSKHTIELSAQWMISYRLSGTTKAWWSAVCELSSFAGEPKKFSLVSYTADAAALQNATGQEVKEIIDTTQKTATGTTAPVAQKNPTVAKEKDPVKESVVIEKKPVPESLSGWKEFPSVRWWTMYVSKNVVSYRGTILTGGSEQPSCAYRLDMQYRTNTWSTIDALLYECPTSSEASLSSAGYSKVWSVGTTIFMMKYLTDRLNAVDVMIQ